LKLLKLFNSLGFYTDIHKNIFEASQPMEWRGEKRRRGENLPMKPGEARPFMG
jgi:hypothetical protein